MRLLWLFVALLLAACNTPTPQFYGVEPVRVTMDGSAYRVFQAEDRAQVLRVSPEMLPNKNAEAKIIHAIRFATGCNVVGKLKGDVALANARIDCGAGARPWPVEVELLIDCDIEKDDEFLYCVVI
ncbi:MAG: hypothetical protein AAGI10_04250 [Pseudomonadota bacterium]